MKVREMMAYVKSDLKRHGGNGMIRSMYVYCFDARFRLLLNYRLGRFFKESEYKAVRFICSYLQYKQIVKRNCQISYKAKLGHRIMFKHPLGIVIGENVIVGDNVDIWQQVTLGSHGKSGMDLSYPTIEDNVKIFAGAKLFGAITVAEGAVIGANSVVNKNVLPGDTVVGIPAISIKMRK